MGKGEVRTSHDLARPRPASEVAPLLGVQREQPIRVAPGRGVAEALAGGVVEPRIVPPAVDRGGASEHRLLLLGETLARRWRHWARGGRRRGGGRCGCRGGCGGGCGGGACGGDRPRGGAELELLRTVEQARHQGAVLGGGLELDRLEEGLDRYRVELEGLGTVTGLVSLDSLLGRKPRARQGLGSRRGGGRCLDGQPTRELLLDRRGLRWCSRKGGRRRLLGHLPQRSELLQAHRVLDQSRAEQLLPPGVRLLLKQRLQPADSLRVLQVGGGAVATLVLLLTLLEQRERRLPQVAEPLLRERLERCEGRHASHGQQAARRRPPRQRTWSAQ